MKRDGTRIRENFTDQQAAECRQVALTTEYLTGQRETTVQATKLSETQIRLAEAAFIRLDADQDLMLAVEYWLKHGKQLAVAESPRLDDAFTDYCAWLPQSGLRIISQNNQRRRVNVFANSVSNLRVSDLTHELIENFLTKRDVSPLSRR